MAWRKGYGGRVALPREYWQSATSQPTRQPTTSPPTQNALEEEPTADEIRQSQRLSIRKQQRVESELAEREAQNNIGSTSQLSRKSGISEGSVPNAEGEKVETVKNEALCKSSIKYGTLAYVTDSSDEEEEVFEADSAVVTNHSPRIKFVTAMQPSVQQYLKILAKPSRRRTFSRFLMWISKGVNYRDINDISNSEVVNVGGTPYNPNLPGFAARYIDCHLSDFNLKTFTARLYEPDSEEVRAQVSISAHFREFDEALVYRVTANAHSDFGFAGRSHRECGSLSEVYQTEHFRDAARKVKEEFGEDINVCPVDIFSDATHVNSFGSESIQPIELEIAGGYTRHLRASDFDKLTCIVGWVPLYKDALVSVNRRQKGKKKAFYGKIEWSQLTQADERALTRELNKQIYTFIYDELRKAIHDKIFEFPYPKVGRIVFIFTSFKGDQPEKNRWANCIGCQVCTKSSSLILDDSFVFEASKIRDGSMMTVSMF
jgi:hypothetical protein